MSSPRFSLLLLAAVLAGTTFSFAQNNASPSSGGANKNLGPGSADNRRPVARDLNESANPLHDASIATDPSYRLTKGDTVAVIVQDEGDLSKTGLIDHRGQVRLPYIGEVELAGKTVQEAERYLEKLLIEREYLKKPYVTVSVREYFLREISVLGAVNSPGKFPLPREATSMDIAEVFIRMGGLKPTAKADQVRVTRVVDGVKKTEEVDVRPMLNPKTGSRETIPTYPIYPGDLIYVVERLW